MFNKYLLFVVFQNANDFNCIFRLDLYEFAKNKTIVSGLAFSPDGKRFATLSTDRKVRVFTFLTGKLIRVFDETLARYQEIQQSKHALPNMEFGRKYVSNSHFDQKKICSEQIISKCLSN